jgi:hypothetical protein
VGLCASAAEPAGAGELRLRPELFLGVAHAEGHDNFAAGLAGEYRFGRFLGVGGFMERTGGAEEAWSFGVPLSIHPYEGVRLLLAPGQERKEVQEEGEAKKTEQSWLLRAGVAYEIEIGRWSLTPEFNVDFIEGGHHVLVYGASVGYGF